MLQKLITWWRLQQIKQLTGPYSFQDFLDLKVPDECLKYFLKSFPTSDCLSIRVDKFPKDFTRCDCHEFSVHFRSTDWFGNKTDIVSIRHNSKYLHEKYKEDIVGQGYYDMHAGVYKVWVGPYEDHIKRENFPKWIKTFCEEVIKPS